MKPGIDYLPGPESARKPQILFFFTLYIGLRLSLMPIPDAFSSASESCKATRHMLRLERSLRRHSPKTLPSTQIPRSAPSIAVGLVGGEARADDLHRY